MGLLIFWFSQLPSCSGQFSIPGHFLLLFSLISSTFLAQETLLFNSIRDLLAQQFDRLSDLEQQVMYWLAIHQEAVTAAQLQADLIPSVSRVELQDALLSLNQRSLIVKAKSTVMEVDATTLEVSYTQQPVVMEYVTECLIHQVCQDLEQAQVTCLRCYALIKVRTKDEVREMQLWLVVQSILVKLLALQGTNFSQTDRSQCLCTQANRQCDCLRTISNLCPKKFRSLLTGCNDRL
jgi:hypothetical protein